MDRRRMMMGKAAEPFPEEPEKYELIGKYTVNQTWKAPENGWFQIEVYGASGSGGTGNSNWNVSGGGGGGGGLSVARIKLKKDEEVLLTVGNTTKAKINGSMVEEKWKEPSVTAAESGTDYVLDTSEGYKAASGKGGAGGIAFGGNFANFNGEAGGNGRGFSGGAGGNQGGFGKGYPSENAGGKGGGGYGGIVSGESGKPGFFRIYRGNFNR